MQPLERDVETLRNIPLFAGLPTARLKLIAYTADIVRFEPGEVIVQQGDLPDGVYIITEGEAEVWLADTTGQSRCLAVLGAHSLFGETAVLARSRRTATVRAKDRVVTFKISSNVFLDLVRSSSDIGMQVMTILAERLERSTALLRQHERQ
jgi:CRP-like cAMP-binding protein